MWVSYKSPDLLASYIETTAYKIDAHIHAHYEFLWLIAGDASYIIDSEIYQLHPGDIVITPPDKLHTISFNSTSEYRRFFIQLSPRMLSRMPGRLVKNITSLDGGGIIPPSTAEACGLYGYYDRLAEILKDTTKHSEHDKYLAELIAQEFALAVNKAMKKPGQTEDSFDDPVIAKVKAYLDSNYTREIRLDEMAKSFYMSKFYLCHRFKDETGITINDYIALKRIAAVRELKNREKGIGDIYRRCGFNDYSSFYRVIKKYTGMKPSEFFE